MWKDFFKKTLRSTSCYKGQGSRFARKDDGGRWRWRRGQTRMLVLLSCSSSGQHGNESSLGALREPCLFLCLVCLGVWWVSQLGLWRDARAMCDWEQGSVARDDSFRLWRSMQTLVRKKIVCYFDTDRWKLRPQGVTSAEIYKHLKAKRQLSSRWGSEWWKTKLQQFRKGKL